MFQIVKQTGGKHGAFVRLVRLDSDDFAVIVRHAQDSRLHHRYVGPDQTKAEEVFDQESSLLEKERAVDT